MITKSCFGRYRPLRCLYYNFLNLVYSIFHQLILIFGEYARHQAAQHDETENKNKFPLGTNFPCIFCLSNTGKINKTSICRYHTDAITNYVFKIIATLDSLLFN